MRHGTLLRAAVAGDFRVRRGGPEDNQAFCRIRKDDAGLPEGAIGQKTLEVDFSPVPCEARAYARRARHRGTRRARGRVTAHAGW